MANRIKGITVEIGGDTTKLSKALEGVNKNPDSAKFKGIKTVKNHDDTAFYVCFGVIENFTHQVKLQAVIILPINNVISMQFSHFCQSNFADSGRSKKCLMNF